MDKKRTASLTQKHLLTAIIPEALYEEKRRINEMKSIYQILDELRVTTDTTELERGVLVKLTNGKDIFIQQSVNYNDLTWPWKIDGQIFYQDETAASYLMRRITEKLTGKRMLLRKYAVPDICGVDGCGCRHPKECNTALCMDCPIGEKFHADRDGVQLVYATE